MQILKDAQLKDYTSYKLGGPAKSLIIVETVDELLNLEKDILREAIVVGGGTNILVSDKGVDRDVIKIDFNGYELGNKYPNSDIEELAVQSGTNLSQMSIELARRGYKDFEFAIGIPGTVGGAVVMNAGTDRFIADVLRSVHVLTRDGEKKALAAQELKYGYRESILQSKDWIVLHAYFNIRKGEPLSEEKIQERLGNRAKSQPLTFPSAGCWFKGPYGHNDIIKEIGMDGKWVGGAVSSPLFPAFILNVGATASDVHKLVKEMQSKAAAIGKPLTCEIKLVGDFDE